MCEYVGLAIYFFLIIVNELGLSQQDPKNNVSDIFQINF